MASTSKTEVASRCDPCRGGSPVVSSTLGGPSHAPEQVGLHADQVAIAAAVVQQGLDVALLLDQHAEARALARPPDFG
jgi:hypothetical protein